MRPRFGTRLLGGAALIAAAGVALAANGAPRSILPEGVFAPAPTPPPATAPAPAQPPPASVDGPPRIAPDALASDGPPGVAPPAPVPTATTAPLRPPAPSPLEAPLLAGDTAITGLLTLAAGGYGPDTFAGSDARMLARLMARLDAPIGSRWAHIVLRRALASRVPAPAGVPPADWAAVRARLLMGMGEADVARAMLARVPVAAYTPGAYRAAADIALASADMPGLCPLAPTGRALSPALMWKLAAAMCAAFEGDDITAANLFDEARETPGVPSFDVALAERVASSAGGARAANLEWDEVDRLNLYRIGLASAAGVEIPERQMETASAPARAWLFRAPAASEATRLAMVLPAAAQGVLSSAEAAGFFAALADMTGGAGPATETATRLRTAFVGTADERIEALRLLWREARDEPWGARVLTAGAAVSLRPDGRFAADAPDIAASAIAGGRADVAMNWGAVAAGDDAAGDRLWAIAAAAGAEVDPARFARWAKAERGRNPEAGTHRARLLRAALVADGRGAGLDAAYETPPLGGRWAERLAAAAAAGRKGEVALLAAIGLQCAPDAIPARHLEAIVSAYARVGWRAEARLIAAEAMART